MPVVRNDSNEDIQIPGRYANMSKIAPGEVRYLTDKEYEKVDWLKRGSGQLTTVSPSETTGEDNKLKLDYEQFGSEYEVRYMGYARQTAEDDDEVWTVRRHGYSNVGGEWLLTEIQVLQGRAWSDRATLPWV